MKNKPTIIMMGSDLNVQGGVSEVEKEYLKAGLKNKVNLTLIPSHIDGSKSDKLKIFLRALKTYALLPTRQPTILHLHLSHGASFFRKYLLTLLAKVKRHKVIQHLHGSDFEEFMYQSRVHTFLTRQLFNHSDHIIVLSRRWKRLLKDFTRNPQITTLYNPAPRINTPIHGQGHPTILFMGRLGKRKGVYDLLDVIKQQQNTFRKQKATFILAGDGETEKVRHIIRQHQLHDLVKVPGWVSGAQKTSYLQNSHILILPSYNEQMPMSILEAMAYGYPVLATDIAGIPEMVEPGINGFLFPPGDKEKMAHGLKQLCADATLRKKMGRNSRKIIARKFDGHLITDQLVNLYKGMI